MSPPVPRLPLRAWTALSGAGLACAFAVLVAREANPDWARHQRAFSRFERVEAAAAARAAEDALRQPAAQQQARELASRVEAAETALARLQGDGGYGRARGDLERAERELADVQEDMQRTRAEYQAIEREFLLSQNDEARRHLRARLDELRVKVDALGLERERLASARDTASRRVRVLTAEVDAAQAALDALYEPVKRANADLASAARRRPQVQQFLIDSLERADRCTSCHIAATRPGFERMPEPLRTHVGRYIGDHPSERFGCTICHGGQGRATRLPAAHGRVPHWRQPLLDGDLVGGRCAMCHRGETVPGEPYAAAGRRLFLEAGCHGCHEVEGVAAPRIGPPLGGVGAKVGGAWLAWWLRDPKGYLPQTRMPNFLLPDQEIADLSAFLLSLRQSSSTEPVPGTAAPAPEAAKRGEALFKESRCVTCHAVNTRGGTIGPELGRVASKLRDAWLTAFLREPVRLSPGTKMPRYRFTGREVTDLVAYITAELRDFDEQSWPSPPAMSGGVEAGQGLVRKYGCFGCHDIPGFERSGRVGAELTGYADKEVERLDFGLRRDVPRTWRAWTETKLRDPRSFRDGLKMADFQLSTRERFSLLTYLASLTEEKPPAEYLRDAGALAAYEPEGRFGELVTDLNCLVCHSIRGRGGSLAPDLTREGSRVRADWLRRFLDQPGTIRLSLEERMPRFRLSREEIEAIADYIENVLVDPAVPKTVFAPGEVTPGLVQRGKALYYDTYACDGCHQIGMTGGAVGPELTATAERLTEGWVYAWLRNSRALDPNAREPVYELPDEEARAIAAFLLSLKERELYRTGGV